MSLLGKLFSKANAEHVRESCEPHTIYAPLQGEVVDLAQVPDQVFSSGTMGQGIAVIPEEGKLYAPVNGSIEVLFPTKHAIGIRSEEGVEIILHVGIDTVSMDGEGFKSYVDANSIVRAGQLLLEFDIDSIKKHGLNPITMILITNLEMGTTLQRITASHVEKTEKLLWY